MAKKILFLIPSLGHGGAERVLINLVNNLDKSKYDVTVQTLFDVGVNRKYLTSDVRYIAGFRYQFRGNSHFQKLFHNQKTSLKSNYNTNPSFHIWFQIQKPQKQISYFLLYMFSIDC